MKRALAAIISFLALCSPAAADALSPWTSPPGLSSTLQLTSTTTGYTSGQLIATSATAASVVVPSFAIPQGYQSAAIPRVRLSTNDSTSTAWGAQTVTVDLWGAAPTFTNGDRGAYSPATGTANHLGSYSCVMSSEYGDGAYAECAAAVGNFSLSSVSGGKIFWSLTATSGSGTTGASKVFTLTPEFWF